MTHTSASARMVNVAVQVLPKVPDDSAYRVVDAAIAVIRRSGVKYRVCPFETVMEGPYDQLMDLVAAAQPACFEAGASEVLVNVKIQHRRDGDVHIEEKTAKYDDAASS